jgi:soluble cytochrome b562
MNQKNKIINHSSQGNQWQDIQSADKPIPDRRKNRAERLRELKARNNPVMMPNRSLRKPSRKAENLPRPAQEKALKQKRPPTNEGQQARGWGWPLYWLFWMLAIALIPGGAGLTALHELIRLPSRHDCSELYLPLTSAAKRLYCAEVKASSYSIPGLLEAIALVNALPQENPLRSQANSQIEKWSEKILSMGEMAFQDGNIEKAIATARQVPSNVTAYPLVESRVQKWESIWNKAEETYQKAEQNLRNERWHDAYLEATRLLSVPNSYWENTKYVELTARIREARQDGKRLNQARDVGDKGGFENLAEAIKQADEIEQKSYLYQAAQKLIVEYGNEILDLALAKLDEGEWQETIRMVSSVPPTESLQKMAEDLVVLARAHSPAELGTVGSIEDAIRRAKEISSQRPLYTRAQGLINRWEREIGDVSAIEESEKLARRGRVNDLQAAIAKLRTIPASNPRALEAKGLIARWTNDIEEIEDAPLLEKADRLASFGDVESLETAIATASQVNKGRVLYPDAQRRIQNWTERIERYQDQPLLDKAQQLAFSGKLDEAIALLETIKPGRILYNEARTKIRSWSSELEAARTLENARRAATVGTPDAYITAIMLANQVPTYNPNRSSADLVISEWSQQILMLAMDAAANSDLQRAIEIANRVPYGTSAYTAAQAQIQTWRSLLAPPPSYGQPVEDDRQPTREEPSGNYPLLE